MTVRARFRFTVKQSGDGTLWILLEPAAEAFCGEGLPPSGMFGFDLPEGATIEYAAKVAKFCNENIEGLCFTAMLSNDGPKKGQQVA